MFLSMVKRPQAGGVDGRSSLVAVLRVDRGATPRRKRCGSAYTGQTRSDGEADNNYGLGKDR